MIIKKLNVLLLALHPAGSTANRKEQLERRNHRIFLRISPNQKNWRLVTQEKFKIHLRQIDKLTENLSFEIFRVIDNIQNHNSSRKS